MHSKCLAMGLRKQANLLSLLCLPLALHKGSRSSKRNRFVSKYSGLGPMICHKQMGSSGVHHKAHPGQIPPEMGGAGR